MSDRSQPDPIVRNRVALTALIDAGLPLSEVADRAGCSVARLRRAARRLGLPPSKPGRKTTPALADRDALAALIASGLSTAQIAEQVGRSTNVVRAWVKRHGLTLPPHSWRPPDPQRIEGRMVHWGDLVRSMGGRLAGFTAHVRFELVDGDIKVGTITYAPADPMPLGMATNRVLRDLRLGDVPATAEACLRNIVSRTGHGIDWLEALAATRKRPGRAGTADQLYARVGQRRIEAEGAAPGKAIRYMVNTWPDEFASASAAHSKVNKAIKRGMLERTDDGLRMTERATKLLAEGE